MKSKKEYLQAIKSSGDTLIVLIDDILDLAKVDAGKMIFINAPLKCHSQLLQFFICLKQNSGKI
jgi:signal transduction histidine kinase